jgi:hypothetical protein
MRMISVVGLVLLSSVASARSDVDGSTDSLLVRFLPTQSTARMHALVEGYVTVENLGHRAIRVPVALDRYVDCIIKNPDGTENSCMGEFGDFREFL